MWGRGRKRKAFATTAKAWNEQQTTDFVDDKPEINPETGEFFVTDAKDYVTPGTLYCFSRDGKKKWSVITGDIPAHIAFTDKKLKEIQ